MLEYKMRFVVVFAVVSLLSALPVVVPSEVMRLTAFSNVTETLPPELVSVLM